MPLELNSLSQADRAYLAELVPSEPTDQEVQDIAAKLLAHMLKDPHLMQQAVYEVRRLVGFARQNRVSQQVASHKYYQFGTKHHSSSPEHATYYNWKIHDYDFKRFCAHYGLSERSMLRVAAGEIDAHKGWCQGDRPGNLGVPRTQYIAKINPNPAGMMLIPYQGEWPTGQQAKVFLPSQWWTPPAE